MTETEGVIQYRLDYQPGTLPPDAALSGLFHWFCRRGFVISGTQTGGRAALTPDDLAWVLDFDIANNQLTATGPSRPSSEAMTHGQIYRGLAAVNAVIHIHSPRIWQQARALRLPMTARFAGYMGGHEDGVVSYASGIDTAGELLLTLQAQAERLLGAG